MSSLMDSWLLLQDFEGNGERNRVLYVLKARGMAHSNQVREFLISDHGIDLVDAYIGPSGVLTGSARVAQAAREKADVLASQQEAARRKREVERKRATLERQIERAALRVRNRSRWNCGASTNRSARRHALLTTERTELGRLRQADADRWRPRTRGRLAKRRAHR